ncbi:hypothetical protein ACFLUU_02965 [Chloroflexota bacterium]
MGIASKMRNLARNIASFRKDKMNSVEEIRKEEKEAGKKLEA